MSKTQADFINELNKLFIQQSIVAQPHEQIIDTDNTFVESITKETHIKSYNTIDDIITYKINESIKETVSKINFDQIIIDRLKIMEPHIEILVKSIMKDFFAKMV